jgi:7-carboxy-7-deazaguanine synthase
MKAEVTEIFSSIQGEGLYLGVKQIFVRFKGCNLICQFCDTPGDLVAREYEPLELLQAVERIEAESGPHHSLSLTGGEPLLRADFLLEFLPLFRKGKAAVFLETNGTLPAELRKVIDLVDIIAMDFKLPSSTGEEARWEEHRQFLIVGRKKKIFVKAVITAATSDDDICRAIGLMKEIDREIPLVIQPVHSESAAVSVGRLMELAKRASADGLTSVRVIPQVHKMMGVR